MHQWGDPEKSFWNKATSNQSGGVGILLGTRKDITQVDCKIPEGGRILNILLNIRNTNVQLMNIYAPNIPADTPPFYQTLDSYTFP